MNDARTVETSRGRLPHFIAACRTALQSVTGFEFSMIAILSALLTAADGIAEWTAEEAGRRAGVGPRTAVRLMAIANSVGLLKIEHRDDAMMRVHLTDAGRAAIQQIEGALG